MLIAEGLLDTMKHNRAGDSAALAGVLAITPFTVGVTTLCSDGSV